MGLIAWLLLFTFGLGGVITALLDGSGYMSRNYFQRPQFEGEVGQYIDLLSKLQLSYIPKEDVKKNITVSAEEINEHRYRYGDLSSQTSNIKGQYETKIQEAIAADNQVAANLYIAERDKKIEDITQNFTDDEHVRQKIVKEKEEAIDKYYEVLDQERTQFNSYGRTFKYYLQDALTGTVYTNLDVTDEASAKKLLSEKDTLFLQTYSESNPLGQKEYYAEQYEGLAGTFPVQRTGTFTGMIAVPKWADETSIVMISAKQYKEQQKAFFIYTIAGLIAFVLSLYVYKRARIRYMMTDQKWNVYYERIPIDIRAAFFLFSALLALGYAAGNRNDYYYMSGYGYEIVKGQFFDLTIAAVLVAITLVQGILLRGELKAGRSVEETWKSTLLYKMYETIKQAFLIRKVGTQVMLVLAFIFLLGAGLLIVGAEPELIVVYIPVFLAVGIPLFIIIMKQTAYLNRILLSTNELAEGKPVQELPVKGKTVLASLAGNINVLKGSVKLSQKEQAKSERLKTELITNVSHDLRTPLTSIITYTNLLKTQELEAEDRDAYIEIIDRKSKRLKVLIDDLFEASKMASGSVELAAEKIDLVQLLQQALAEYDETIQQSTLQFRVTHSQPHVYAIVDGPKIWRVFDNVIGNILKYSLEHTRVYISTVKSGDKAVITFKNVSKYELGGNTDELFERFKRGDTSRHTEGSGLGLAIAKSIVDLHDGSFDIEADGDLFKVTVSMDAAE